MNAKWTSAVVAGTVLILLGGQAMAQPWGGRGQGFGRGQGMGRMGQGAGPMRQGMGRGSPQGGPGAWCPLGIGPGRQGAWGSQGMGQVGFGRQLARRLNLTDDQVQKIQDIVEKARSRTLEAIKGVLTEEQAGQFEQMRENVGQFRQGRRGPAMQDGSGGPAGPRFQRGQGLRGQMGPRGQGPAGQAFQGGPGRGRGMRQGGGVNPPEAPAEPPTRGQGMGRGVPPIERMFDQADTNNDGALTREEIRAFHEKMGPGLGRRSP